MSYRVADQRKTDTHDDSIWCINWTKKSNLIITGSVDSTIRVWKGDSLEPVHKFSGHRLGVISIDSDDSGKYAFSSSMDSVIRVWDLEKGKSVTSIDVPPLEAWSISAFGKQIATGSASGNVNLYNLESSKKEQSLDTQKKSFVMAVSYSKCGRFLACGSQDGSVCVFDVATSKLLHNLQGHSMTIRSVKFTNDSQKLITASDDKHIHVYDVKTGSLIKALDGHSSYVLSLSVSPDNVHFASSGTDKQVKIWEFGKNDISCIYTFQEHKDQVWGTSYNENGGLLASVGDDRLLALYVCPLDMSK